MIRCLRSSCSFICIVFFVVSPCLCCPFPLVLLTSSRDGTVQIISPTTTSPRTISTLERLSLKRMFHTVSDRVSPRHLGFGSTSTSSPFGGGNTGGSLFGNTSSSFGSGGGTCSMTGFLVSFAILLVVPASFPLFSGHIGCKSPSWLSRGFCPNAERMTGVVSEALALFPGDSLAKTRRHYPDRNRCPGIRPWLSFELLLLHLFVIGY